MTQVPRELWPVVFRLAAARDWPPRSDDELAAFFKFANRQMLLPLLMADTDLPPAVMAAKARFRALDALYHKRYGQLREAMLELVRVLGTDGFAFVKGADYCHRLYSRPQLRPMVDIDIFVRSPDFAAMLERLTSAGYPRKYGDHGAPFAPGYHEVSVDIGGVHVEPHRSFAQRVRARVDYDGIWQHRERFDQDGICGCRLSPADTILCDAFNHAGDEFSSKLVRYVDLCLMLQRYEDELDLCVERAKAWKIERAFFGALHIVFSLFPSARTDTHARAMERLLDKPARRFLVDRVLPDPATEPSGHVMGRRTQLWRKYALMDQSWRGFALFAYHAYELVTGSAIEWHLRRSGHFIPPRPKAR